MLGLLGSPLEWHLQGVTTPTQCPSGPLGLPPDPGYPFKGFQVSGLRTSPLPLTKGQTCPLCDGCNPCQTAEQSRDVAPVPPVAQDTPAWAGTTGEPSTIQEPGHLEGHEDSVSLIFSPSFSPDNMVAGASASGPQPIDPRAHQDLFCCIAHNMVTELEDLMVDSFALEGPSRVALPIIKMIQNNKKTQWQTPASILPTARGWRESTLSPPKN